MAAADQIPHEASKSHALGMYPVRCSALRKNGFVMMKGHPCKIMEMVTSAPGKHGHAKVHLVGLDVFSGKRFEEVRPAHKSVDVPEIKKCEYQVVSIGYTGYLSLMDDDGFLLSHFRLPGGPVGAEMKNKFNRDEYVMAVVLRSMEMETVVGYKIVRE